jgi:hypothetical protein
MNTIEAKQIFYINSDDRISGTASNFSYKLDLNPNDEYDKCVVLQCLLPKSYYVIRAGFNTFQIYIEDQVSPGSYETFIISITPGNYNRRALAVELENKINTAFSTAYSVIGININITYTNGINSGDTGKYTYVITSPSPILAEFIFTENVYYALGFNKNSLYTFNTIDGLTLTLVSENVIDLNLEDSIFIHSDIIDDSEGNNILQDVYCAANDPNFSNIHYVMIDLQANTKKLKQSLSNIIRIYITDEIGSEINFNGLNIVITLMFYKTSNLWRKLSGFLSLATLKI